MHFLLSFLIQLLDLTPPKFPLFQGQYLRGQHYQCHECALKVSSVYSPTQDASHKWRLRLGFPILKNDVILVVTVTGWGENWCLFWKLKGIYTPFLNWLVVEPSIWKVVEFRSFPQTGMKINEDFKPPPMVMNISTFRIQQIFPMENQKHFLVNQWTSRYESDLENWIQPIKRIIFSLAMLRVQSSNTRRLLVGVFPFRTRHLRVKQRFKLTYPTKRKKEHHLQTHAGWGYVCS